MSQVTTRNASAYFWLVELSAKYAQHVVVPHELGGELTAHVGQRVEQLRAPLEQKLAHGGA